MLLSQTAVSEEQPSIAQSTETITATEPIKPITEETTTPAESVLLSVSEEEGNIVIVAYTQGIPRREICAFLRWGSAKYSTIVKPVLDSYLEQQE